MRPLQPLSAWFTLLSAACVAAPQWQGPLPTRNQHPAQLTVMQMAPAAARVLAAGASAARLDSAYSSLFLSGNSPGANWLMDGELLRTAATVRHGLGSGLEVAAELPFAHASGGFLDALLIDYHELFGFPDQNRDTTERDRFLVSARQNGNEVFGMEPHGVHLLDVPLWLTWQAVAPTEHGPGLALRTGLELPSGDDGRGYGNGELDYSLGAVLEWRAAGIGWYGHAQHTFAGSPASARQFGFDFADVTTLGLAAELPLTNGLHAFAQLAWENSTLRRLAVPAAERDQMLLWIGGRLRLDEQWAIEVAFGEDLIGKASPDFTAWLGVAWLPAAGGS
ncbi:MAG: DUF3187 family protein [Planctomycetes bacterium]|nr:DUF3187 family protein [Planctomycetota bacterium]